MTPSDLQHAPGASATLASCLWSLDRRDELTARLTAAARIATPGPAERFELSYADVAPALSPRARTSAPAVLRVGAGAGALLAIVDVSGDGERLRLIATTGDVVACDAAELSAYLRAPLEVAARAGIENTVAAAGFDGARRPAITDALLRAALGRERAAEGTRLEPARPSMWAALRAAGVTRGMAVAIGGYLAQLAFVAALWGIVGARAVAADAGGRAGSGLSSIAIIAAVIAALVATRLLSSWTAGRLAIDGGQVLRHRLMNGLLSLDTESIRAEGIGQLLGRVVETEALESLALGGGLTAAAGAFELATGAVVVALGVAAAAQLALLAAWIGVAALLAAGVQRALARWAAGRIALTHDLVERMVGQRTLVAQQAPALRHREEDAALDDYGRTGRALDRAVALLLIVVPRGWLVAAVVALAPSFAAAGARPGAFATSLGGTLLIYGALRKLAQAFPALGAARIAWRQVAPMLATAAAAQAVGAPRVAPSRPADGEAADAGVGDTPLIAVRDVAFRYPGRAAAVLSACSLDIRQGDRVLLEGPSGGGKSTLGALLSGLRVPDGGSLALRGVDQGALGLPRWRGHVGAAPQFHENHVFLHSLTFNLLLGRAWPPRREDIAEAEAVLRELDLGPLLARMPSGLEQLVGEGGWQLSHGERSRLYIARSLLQPLDVRVLDESFAALDPETLERALACVLARSPTLVVIAHP